MPQPPPRRPGPAHPSFHAFSALACVSAVLALAGIYQGGTAGWTAALVMFLVTAGFIGCACLAWIAQPPPPPARDDEDVDQ